MEREIWASNRQSKTRTCKLQPNRQSYAAIWRIYQLGVGWACDNDSAFCQITFVFVKDFPIENIVSTKSPCFDQSEIYVCNKRLSMSL